MLIDTKICQFTCSRFTQQNDSIKHFVSSLNRSWNQIHIGLYQLYGLCYETNPFPTPKYWRRIIIGFGDQFVKQLKKRIAHNWGWLLQDFRQGYKIIRRYNVKILQEHFKSIKKRLTNKLINERHHKGQIDKNDNGQLEEIINMSLDIRYWF